MLKTSRILPVLNSKNSSLIHDLKHVFLCVTVVISSNLYNLPKATADDKLILAQKVELKTVDGNPTLVGVGKGPFTDMYPNGIDQSGKVTEQKPGKPSPADDLTQGRIPPGAGIKRDFGSIGASQGSIILNSSGKEVKEIEITTKGKDSNNNDNKIDPKSKDGDDFEVQLSPDGKTITLKAKAGKELQKNERIWMLIPKGPQPGDPGPKIYEGKVTLASATPSAPGFQIPGNPKAEATSASVSFQTLDGVGTLSFKPATIDLATYLDGTTSNSPTDKVIGGQILIDNMKLLGPSPDIPGAFQFSDSSLAVVGDGQTLFQSGLTNVLLVPDPENPGKTHFQADLGFLIEGRAGGSRFLDEYFNFSSNLSGLFSQSDLLSVTKNFTISGETNANILLSASVPEPLTFLGVGTAVGFGTFFKRKLNRF